MNLQGLKRSFQSALETYKRYGEQRPATTSIVEEIFSEYEEMKSFQKERKE